MIQITRIEGAAVPELCCDVCLKPIRDVDMGMMVWFEDISANRQSTVLVFCHKGQCDRRLRKIRGEDCGWHELKYGMSLFMDQVAPFVRVKREA